MGKTLRHKAGKGRMGGRTPEAKLVVPPGEGEQWDYRRAAVERIQAAVRVLLIKMAGAGWLDGEELDLCTCTASNPT